MCMRPFPALSSSPCLQVLGGQWAHRPDPSCGPREDDWIDPSVRAHPNPVLLSSRRTWEDDDLPRLRPRRVGPRVSPPYFSPPPPSPLLPLHATHVNMLARSCVPFSRRGAAFQVLAEQPPQWNNTARNRLAHEPPIPVRCTRNSVSLCALSLSALSPLHTCFALSSVPPWLCASHPSLWLWIV